MHADENIRERQVRELFDACVDLSPAERARRLAGIDPDIRAEVEALLEADGEAAEILMRLDTPNPPASQQAKGGQLVGRYELIRELGRGGMGVVHLARDTALDRTLVLKFLSPDIAREADARERFAREAKAASALDHPNICTVYDVGTTEAGSMYIAMAHYEGKTLKDRISEGPMTVDEVVEIASQVLGGLGRAHDAGIVHRDIKPANVMLTDRGEVKILDFGLAKTAGPGITQSGMIMGTIGYMAPEQVLGKEVDSRADLWANGVMLYEMLSGQRPFRGEYDQAILYLIAHEEPARLEEVAPDVPEPIAALVHELLHKDPAARPASAHAVGRRLDDWASASTTTAVQPTAPGRRKFLYAAGVMTAGILAAAAAIFWTGRSEGDAIGDLLAEGRYYRSLEGPQHTRMAIDRFREVVRLDSLHAVGYAKLSEGYILLGDDDSEPLAREALQTALVLDSSASEAYVSQGLVYELYDRDWASAESAFRRAVSLDPTNEAAHYELGWLLIRTGRIADGQESMRRARSLDTGSILTLYGKGIADFYAGRYDEAARAFQGVLDRDARHAMAFFYLLMSHLHGERFVAATELLNRITDVGAFYRSPLGAYYFAATGVRQSAIEVMTDLGDDMPVWDRAKVLVALGEPDRAIEQLESAMDDPPRVMNELGIEPAFASIRDDPRYRDMIRRLGLSVESG